MSIDTNALRRVLTSSKDLAEASLATKILVSRLRKEVAAQPSTLDAAVQELNAFFAKHSFATKDIAAF